MIAMIAPLPKSISNKRFIIRSCVPCSLPLIVGVHVLNTYWCSNYWEFMFGLSYLALTAIITGKSDQLYFTYSKILQGMELECIMNSLPFMLCFTIHAQ